MIHNTKKILIFISLSAMLILCYFTSAYADTPSNVEDLVEIVIGDCTWDGSESHTTITINLGDTKFNLYKGDWVYGPLYSYHSGKQLSLTPGVYTYEWYERDPINYVWVNRQTAAFTISACAPQATAHFTQGACQWTPADGPITPVTITLDHAELTLNGTTYSAASTVITDLSPGTYSYSWVATGGYQGGASNQTLTIEDCSPTAQVSHAIGICNFDNGQSLTTVTFDISGASVILNSGSGTVYNLTEGASVLKLPAGSYTTTWNVLPHYKGSSGNNGFDPRLMHASPGILSNWRLHLVRCGWLPKPCIFCQRSVHNTNRTGWRLSPFHHKYNLRQPYQWRL